MSKAREGEPGAREVLGLLHGADGGASLAHAAAGFGPGPQTKKEQQKALPTGRGTGSARVNLGVKAALGRAQGGQGQGANSQSGARSERTHWLKLIEVRGASSSVTLPWEPGWAQTRGESSGS